MFADEGDELLIGDTEYIVLNRYTEDGKEYLFVANIMNPEENIADNFDSDAIKLLLLSQDELMHNSAGNDYILNNFLNTYISDDSFEEVYEYNTDINTTNSDEYDNYSESDVVTETNSFFTVEKEPSFIERILEVMFLK